MFQTSIGKKLAATVVASVLVSGVATSFVSLRQGFEVYVGSKREELLTAGRAFAAAASAPVAAGDENGVFSALRGIGSVPHLLQATARDKAGRVLADVGSDAHLDGDPVLGSSGEPSAMSLLKSRTISVVVPVVDAGREVGSLELLSDAGDLWGGLVNSLLASLVGGGVALALGLAIAMRLQHSITKPLRALTATMKHVRDAHDYAQTLPAAGPDEVGVLVAGFNAMLSDIRERDSALVAHRDKLEDDVRERTRDLATAKDVAEQANAAKSMFLATMSHEIRTPMTGMLVMAELLASGELPPRSRRYAEVISKSGATLLAVINDILDFSKIEAGKLEVERVPLDVRDVVATVIDLFYARAREKGLDLGAHVGPGVPRFFAGDPVRLQQVVSNLVNNALKFTQSGHVFVAVDAPRPGELDIAVIDTGIGIAADKLAAIFEAFSQADGSTTRRFGGTGLGLSISSRLVEAMGGKLSVTSTPGEGSTFRCTLPLSEVVEAAPWPRTAASARSRAIVDVSGAGARQALTRMLEDAGYAVSLAGAESEEDGAPGLLVTDALALARLPLRPAADAVIALAEPGEARARVGHCVADLILRQPVHERDVRLALSRLIRGEPLTPARADGERAERASYPQARVLVADDTAVNREIMVEALRRFSITPDLANDGNAALRAAASLPYDLIFMDGSMPELDGFEACRRLRALEAAAGRPRSPVLALTAHVVGEAATAWEAAGMDGILHKPFTMAELERCLGAWLVPGAAADAPTEPAGPSVNDAERDMPLLDPAVLEGIAGKSGGANASFAERVFGLYIEHAPVALDRLRAAALARSHDDLASAAHALKSMSLNMGASVVAATAGSIEAQAQAQTIAEDRIEALAAQLVATLAELSARLDAAREAREDVAARSSRAVA